MQPLCFPQVDPPHLNTETNRNVIQKTHLNFFVQCIITFNLNKSLTVEQYFLFTWSESHFDLDEGFITVSKQILGLPVVDSNYPKEQMT